MGIYKRRSRNSPRITATTAVKNAFRLPSDKAYSLIALNVENDVQVHPGGGGGGGNPYNGLYGEVPPERGAFFRLQVYKRVGISQV